MCSWTLNAPAVRANQLNIFGRVDNGDAAFHANARGRVAHHTGKAIRSHPRWQAMHPKISHLTPEQIDELMARYYRGEAVSSLLKEFQISVKASKLVGLFPPKVHDDQLCPFCFGISMESDRPSRDARYVTAPACPECRHQSSPSCACKHCAAARAEKQRALDDHKREIAWSNFGYLSAPEIVTEEFSLRDAVYLLAVWRHSSTEDFNFVSPFSDRKPLLAPTHEYRTTFVNHLFGRRLIAVSPESDFDSLIFDPGVTKVAQYYPARVRWDFLPGMDTLEKQSGLQSLEEAVKGGPWPERWQSEFREVWHEIAKHECFEYYEHLLAQRGYESVALGPKTHAVFDQLLKTFSVSQIFNLTWQTVRDVTDYIVRERLPKSHAKNSFIGGLQRKADKAIADAWDVKRSRRDFACPQTVVSSVFFDVFAGLGQQAFDRALPAGKMLEQVTCEAATTSVQS